MMLAPRDEDLPAKRPPGLDAFLEQGLVAACLKDAEHEFRYVYANPEWAHRFGREPGECIGKDDYELAPSVADQLHRLDEEARQQGWHEAIVLSADRGNAGRMWYSVAWPVEAVAGHHYVACCSLEIGPRMLAEREATALREYERGAGVAAERALAEYERKHARLVRLFESGIVGVFVGAGDVVLEANRAFLDMLGYTAEDVAAGRLHFSGFSAPEYADLDRETLEDILARGASTPKEKEYIGKDGRRVPVYAAGVLLDAGTLTWIGIVIDRSEQKRLEERLRRSQLWASLGFLAGGLAHDFNNLLVVILGNTALALNDPDLSPETAARLRDVMAAAQKGSQLVEQLLNYSGRGRFVHAPVDLAALVRSSAMGQHTPANVALRLNLGQELPHIDGDPQLVRSLVDNLLSNAVEALGGEGGEITVSMGLEEVASARQLISGQELAPGRYLTLSIEDTGPGIPPHLQNRIFEPFFTTRFLGRGLGLAAALGIARRHGGAIDVTSQVGSGTTFVVFLPVRS